MSKKFPDDFDYYGGPDSKIRDEADINNDVQRVKKWLKKQERETRMATRRSLLPLATPLYSATATRSAR